MCEHSPFKREFLNKSREALSCIWWMNIGVEETWSTAGGAIIPRLSERNRNSITAGMEQMCMLLADSNDVVIMRNSIPPVVTESMKKAGIGLPEVWYPSEREFSDGMTISALIMRDTAIINKLKGLKYSCNSVLLVPYAVTALETDISSATGCGMVGAPHELAAWVNNKVNARSLAEEAGLPVTEGFVCRSVDEILDSIKRLRGSGCGRIIVKDAYGASGKGMYFIDSDKSYELLLHILTRKKNGRNLINVIVERWYDTLLDINYQIFIRDDGTAVFIPPKKQVLNGVIYRGSEFPVNHMMSDEQMKGYEKAAGIIGKSLYAKGYRGIASIDSIITTDDAVFPVIEINGRFSLSTYISFMHELLPEARFFKSAYYDIYSEDAEAAVLDAVRQKNYTPGKGEGLIACSYTGRTENAPGRIFILYACNDLNRLYSEEKRVNEIVRTVG